MDRRVWHRSYDEGVPISIEFEDLTLWQMLERTARVHGNRTAIIFMNCRMTYAELLAEADRFARALSKLGVRRGSRVAIQLPNLPQVVIGYYAAQKLGAQCVMTNPLYVAREIEHQWVDADIDVAIVADFIYAAKIAAIKDRLPVRHYVIASIAEYLKLPLRWLAPLKLRRADPPLWADVRSAGDVHRFRRLVNENARAGDPAAVDIDDVAALQYTGGTTGVSKGAMLTHRNIVYNVQQQRAWFTGFSEGEEIVLTALPFFHVFGSTVCMHMSIYTGSAMVLIPNPRDIPRMIASIVRHRVTMLPAVPAMFGAINETEGIDDVDLGSIKHCFSGSAPLPTRVLRRFEALTSSKICEGFGMTETSPATHVNPLGRAKGGSVGVPLPDTDAKIVDVETGMRAVPPGTEGELVIRGPQVMKGYLDRPEATAEMIRDGWVHTGDLATMDADGYFRIVGRKKDMIIAGGYNIYPDEIDDVLMSHPDVVEAASIGVPDDRRGETVKSFVVFRPGRSVAFEELAAHCRENLAAYKVPRLWEARDALPRSTLMKILRRQLRDQELAARDTDA